MAIRGVEHTSFTVADLARSVAFWTAALGFEVVAQGRWGTPELGLAIGVEGARMTVAILKGHGHAVEFIEYHEPKGVALEAEPQHALAAHIAFRVDDIRGTFDRLVEAGASPHGEISYLDDDPDDAGWCVYLRDPNGVLIELIEPDKPV
jgi:catechol 2,3-dioxygenase-like lactoylglutathione lyase family enzyme